MRNETRREKRWAFLSRIFDWILGSNKSELEAKLFFIVCRSDYDAKISTYIDLSKALWSSLADLRGVLASRSKIIGKFVIRGEKKKKLSEKKNFFLKRL